MRQMRGVAHMLAEQVRVLLVKDDRLRAREALASLEEIAFAHSAEQGLKAEIPALAALAKARVLRDDYPDEALRALQIARGHAEVFGRGRFAALTDMLSALIHAEQKQDEAAQACLIRALDAAQRFGIVRTIIDEGAPAARLLASMLRDGKLHGATMQYAATLLDKFPDAAVPNAAGSRRGTAASKLQPVLTQREVEVLTLVAQAMSNKRIALSLNITLETVKWNLRNIFAKLGVSSRYDAMVWARKHNLID